MQKSGVLNNQAKNELFGLIFGFLAVAGFSVTLPATRIAVSYIDPILVGLGRSLIVVIPAVLLLYWMKSPVPTRKQWWSITIVMFGVVFSFPLLTSIAMQNISGAQGGIVVSVLPLFTAIAGALLLKQRPSYSFWLMALLGSALVLIYLLWSRQGQLQSSELILLGASVLCAIGYAEGGKLAREMGGVAVISWAIVLSVPFTVIPVFYTWQSDNSGESFWVIVRQIPWKAWMGFIYIGFISQWIAFIFWYRGLALGGIVRVSQIQLIQPFLTLLVSAMLLGESITLIMLLFAVAVVITVAIGRNMPVHCA